MSTSTRTGPGHRSTVFGALVLVIVGIAVGHLFVIPELEALYLGVPLWLWVHLGVVGVLFVFAWVATVFGGSARGA